MLLNIIGLLKFFVFFYYSVAEDGGDFDIGRSPEDRQSGLIVRRGLESSFKQPLAQVLARVFEMALDLVERKCPTPNARQGSQCAVDVTLQFATLQGLLRRRRRHVRNDVFQFLVFIRLVKIHNLVAQRRDLFGRRRLRNVFFDVDAAGALRFRAFDFSLNLLNRKPYQPTPDLSPRRVFDKLAVSLQQRGVHHILGCYFARQQVASRQIVGDFSAGEVVEILQVALGERGEEFALALLGRDGFGLLAP